MSGSSEISWLRHHRIDLALHRLADGEHPSARPLLLLHGLGERTPDRVPTWVDWPGPVFGDRPLYWVVPSSPWAHPVPRPRTST